MNLAIRKLIYRLLCNSVTGSLIYLLFRKGIPDLRWPGFKFSVPESSVSKELVASVYWGFYESAEIRFIEKYIDHDLSVIELGSSLGIVSSHIASRLASGRHFITVEANPFLIDTIHTNINRHKTGNSSIDILNRAVGYDSEEVMIRVTNDNTATKILQLSKPIAGDIAVKTIEFAELVKKTGGQPYALVCDIEGSELQILLREKTSLQDCRQLIIELHQTSDGHKDYSIEMLTDIIINEHGFQLRDEHGPVRYFTK